MQYFSCSKVLEYHAKNCLAVTHTKSVILPEKTEYVNFQNSRRLTKASFIICRDFECILILSTDNINFGLNTKKYKYMFVAFFKYRYNFFLFTVIKKYSTFSLIFEYCKKRFNYIVAGHFQHANTDHVMIMSFIEFTDDSFNIILCEFNVCQVFIGNGVS